MRILTGLQPSGDLHLGNYFGSIAQMLNFQQDHEMLIFIADLHAMSSRFASAENFARESLRTSSLKTAAAFLALGIDPDKSIFWRQSDVAEVLELYWILSTLTPLGLLERAHSYKDKLARGLAASHALFSYPVLMAADILLFDSTLVPVGPDQVQHLEIARDLAGKFNNFFGQTTCPAQPSLPSPTLAIPQAKVSQAEQLAGTDGAKMSKSYKNTIDLFASEQILKKQIASITTDSTPLEAPKNWRECGVYKLAALFLDEAGRVALAERYERGGEGYGHFKNYLLGLILDYFGPARTRYEELLSQPEKIEEVLATGAAKARKLARAKLAQIREKIGLGGGYA